MKEAILDRLTSTKIIYRCPHGCKTRSGNTTSLKSPLEHAGREDFCPECNGTFTVPNNAEIRKRFEKIRLSTIEKKKRHDEKQKLKDAKKAAKATQEEALRSKQVGKTETEREQAKAQAAKAQAERELKTRSGIILKLEGYKERSDVHVFWFLFSGVTTIFGGAGVDSMFGDGFSAQFGGVGNAAIAIGSLMVLYAMLISAIAYLTTLACDLMRFIDCE